jgi:hypothetical protein
VILQSIPSPASLKIDMFCILKNSQEIQNVKDIHENCVREGRQANAFDKVDAKNTVVITNIWLDRYCTVG